MTRSKILAAIQSYCKVHTSRQRSDLYDYLNQELSLNLDVYDYDGTNDHARFACDLKSQVHETEYVIKKLAS